MRVGPFLIFSCEQRPVADWANRHPPPPPVLNFALTRRGFRGDALPIPNNLFTKELKWWIRPTMGTSARIPRPIRQGSAAAPKAARPHQTPHGVVRGASRGDAKDRRWSNWLGTEKREIEPAYPRNLNKLVAVLVRQTEGSIRLPLGLSSARASDPERTRGRGSAPRARATHVFLLNSGQRAASGEWTVPIQRTQELVREVIKGIHSGSKWLSSRMGTPLGLRFVAACDLAMSMHSNTDRDGTKVRAWTTLEIPRLEGLDPKTELGRSVARAAKSANARPHWGQWQDTTLAADAPRSGPRTRGSRGKKRCGGSTPTAVLTTSSARPPT